MRPTRCFICWACTAIVAVCFLQAAVYMGAFKTSHARLVSRTDSGSVMESLSLSLTYSRWWRRPDVKAWDPPRPAKPSMPRDEADRLRQRCSQAVDIPKVALLFLTKGDLPHKDMWTMWLRSAAGQLPTNVRYNSFLPHEAPAADSALTTPNATELAAHNASAALVVEPISNASAALEAAAHPEGTDASTASQHPVDDGIPAATLVPADEVAGDASRGRSLLGALRITTRRRLLQEDIPAPEGLTVDDGVELLSNAELQQLTETVAMCQARVWWCFVAAHATHQPRTSSWVPTPRTQNNKHCSHVQHSQQDLDPKEDVVVQQYMFSIYLHTPPNYTMPADPVFAPAVIQDRIFTAWGTHNLTRASKRLLAAALQVRVGHGQWQPHKTRLVIIVGGVVFGGVESTIYCVFCAGLDMAYISIASKSCSMMLLEWSRRFLYKPTPQEPRNRFFVLLSESCMPLYPPQTVYQQLVHTGQSRINACRKDYRDNRDVRRWTHKMTSGTVMAFSAFELTTFELAAYALAVVWCVYLTYWVDDF